MIPFGLIEELELERLRADDLSAQSDAAWRSRQYADARVLRREEAESRAHVARLESELALCR